MNALRNKPLLRFALRFALAFALLAFPWPHWQEAWRTLLRDIAQHTLVQTDDLREVSVAILQPAVQSADIRFTIVNRSLMNSDGSGPVGQLDFTAAQIEMRPMLLLFALIFATPIPWKRRAWYFLAGAAVLQLGILAVLSFSIWRESMEVLLVTDSAGTKAVATAVRNGLVQYSGLFLPLVIWLLLCGWGHSARSWRSPFATTASGAV